MDFLLGITNTSANVLPVLLPNFMYFSLSKFYKASFREATMKNASIISGLPPN